MIRFLALFFVIGSGVHLIRERINPVQPIMLNGESEEAEVFKAKADKVESLYILNQRRGRSEGQSINPGETRPVKIDLNSATLDELMALPKIGQVTAQRIIDYRAKHGGFKTVDELINVKGIGEKTIERLKNEVSIEHGN